MSLAKFYAQALSQFFTLFNIYAFYVQAGHLYIQPGTLTLLYKIYYIIVSPGPKLRLTYLKVLLFRIDIEAD